MLAPLLIGWVDFAATLLIGWLAFAWFYELRYRYRTGDHTPLRAVLADWLGLTRQR